MLWKTIGELGIYAAIMVGFYLLFFHFEQIKNVFAAIFKGKKTNRKKGEKPKTIITPRWEPTAPAIETVKPVVEETQESTVEEPIPEEVVEKSVEESTTETN